MQLRPDEITKVLREQIAQQERKIDEVTARLRNNRHQLTLLNEQIGISEELLKEKLSNRMQHLNLLKEAARLKVQGGLDNVRVRIGAIGQ